MNDGLYQYFGLGNGSYTVSGWVKVLSGSVYLGMGWNSGSSAAFGAAQGPSSDWVYLEETITGINASLGGALVYAASAGSEFYVEGLWLNAGEQSSSSMDPSTGEPVLPDHGSSWSSATVSER